MSNLTGEEGGVRTVSDGPPVHYSVRIQNFSLLGTNSIERYETETFEAGGYKWKLIFHPSGNKSKDVKDHISLYLEMAETGSLPPGWEVHAVFRLFLLDQINDKYITLQDTLEKDRRFHKMKTQWGFDQFITLKAFNDERNGFVSGDSCVFGAEVFICKERASGKGESFTMTKNALSHRHTWVIEDYSKLEDKSYESSIFSFGGRDWKIRFYPKGKDNSTHVSLFLVLAESDSLPSRFKFMVEYSLRILDWQQANHLQGKATHWFTPSSTSRGWAKYVTRSHLNPKSIYMSNDRCRIEVELSILGVTDAI